MIRLFSYTITKINDQQSQTQQLISKCFLYDAERIVRLQVITKQTRLCQPIRESAISEGDIHILIKRIKIHRFADFNSQRRSGCLYYAIDNLLRCLIILYTKLSITTSSSCATLHCLNDPLCFVSLKQVYSLISSIMYLNDSIVKYPKSDPKSDYFRPEHPKSESGK